MVCGEPCTSGGTWEVLAAFDSYGSKSYFFSSLFLILKEHSHQRYSFMKLSYNLIKCAVGVLKFTLTFMQIFGRRFYPK